ncbi:hypothetical protein TNCV_443281 [Trichonephila clavipes]|nr:hypothetical protein TNCV_443281 [Trichonephila clavipes]
MNRCPDLVVCLKRDLQCLRPEASLVLIYRPNVAGMKGRVDLAQPVNRTPDLCENVCYKKFPGKILSKNKHVLLHNLGGCKLRSRITSQPIFNRRLCGGIPDISKEFKNSAGKFTVLFSSPVVSIDLKGIEPPGNNSISGS